MARPRLDTPGALHHTILSAIPEVPLFRDDRDRRRFLRIFERVLREEGARCFAWALLDTHAHFGVQTGAGSLSRLMARIGIRYALGYNRRHARRGRLFAEPYFSKRVDRESYLLQLVRYIHRNPVEAGLVRGVAALARHPWTGHRALMGEPLPFQATDEVLALFGRTRTGARRALCRWMTRHDAEYARLLATPGRWEDERNIERNVIGADSFTVRVVEQAEHAVSTRVRRRAEGWDLDRLLSQVCRVTGVTRSQMLDRVRRPRAVSDARALAMSIAARELGMSQASLARALGTAKSAVRRALDRSERLADDPVFSVWADAAALS